MKAFSCRNCGNPLYFGNSSCVKCGTRLGFSRAEKAIVPVDQHGQYVEASGRVWHVCANSALSGCTWLADAPGGRCFSCGLTRTRPSDDDVKGLSEYPIAESAKRRLIVELDDLGFSIPTRQDDTDTGLAFDLLSSVNEKVTIGHADGVITLDLAEGNDVHREQLRVSMDEPYRTMLGHFRHEIGHFYWQQLVTGDLLRSSVTCSATSAELCRGDRPALQRGCAGRLAGQLHQPVRDDAPVGGLRRDVRALPAHLRHGRDCLGIRAGHGRGAAAVHVFSRPCHRCVGPAQHRAQPDQPQHGQGAALPVRHPPPVLDKLDFVARLARA